LESKLTLLKPNEVYTFMGDSWLTCYKVRGKVELCQNSNLH
jgi:hypothetical protein